MHLRRHALHKRATTMRSPCTATREYPLLTSTRESLCAATKNQYNQKIFFLNKVFLKYNKLKKKKKKKINDLNVKPDTIKDLRGKYQHNTF